VLDLTDLLLADRHAVRLLRQRSPRACGASQLSGVRPNVDGGRERPILRPLRLIVQHFTIGDISPPS
jgi:hypothetical protein